MAVSMNPAMMDATLSEEQMIQMVEQFELDEAMARSMQAAESNYSTGMSVTDELRATAARRMRLGNAQVNNVRINTSGSTSAMRTNNVRHVPMTWSGNRSVSMASNIPITVTGSRPSNRTMTFSMTPMSMAVSPGGERRNTTSQSRSTGGVSSSHHRTFVTNGQGQPVRAVQSRSTGGGGNRLGSQSPLEARAAANGQRVVQEQMINAELGNGESIQIPLNMAHMIGGMNIDQLRNLGEGESAPVQLQVNGAQATGDQNGGPQLTLGPNVRVIVNGQSFGGNSYEQNLNLSDHVVGCSAEEIASLHKEELKEDLEGSCTICMDNMQKGQMIRRLKEGIISAVVQCIMYCVIKPDKVWS